MKKLILATMLATAMGTASAVELGVNAGFNTSGPGAVSYGVTVGEKMGAVGVTGGYDRDNRTTRVGNRYSVVASYDLVNVGNVTLVPKVGGAYLDNEAVATNGYAVLAGVGAEVVLVKHVVATADYRYQFGQDRVKDLNGNQLFAGVKVKF